MPTSLSMKTTESKKRSKMARRLFLEELENRHLMAADLHDLQKIIYESTGKLIDGAPAIYGIQSSAASASSSTAAGAPAASLNFVSQYPTLSSTPIPVGQMPIFSSNPNSPFKLYLDFDGVRTFEWARLRDPANPAAGTIWDPIVSKAFDLDGDPSTFSAVEQKAIFDTWRFVAEDFSMFNVDVRVQNALLSGTEDAPQWRPPGTTIATDLNATVAGTAAFMQAGFSSRVAIGGFTQDWFQSAGTAGVAFIGSFGGTSTGWAWQGDDATDPTSWWTANDPLADNGSALGRIVTHEAGHMLGLLHQAKWLGSTQVEEYSSGNGNWGPIMGIGVRYSTWWNGPTNHGVFPDPQPVPYVPIRPAQDDMAIIASNFVGSTGPGGGTSTDGYRLDLVNGVVTGNTAATAFDIDTKGGSLVWGNANSRNFRVSSVIAQNTDVDYYKFNTRTGFVDLTLRLNQFASDTNTDTYAPDLSAVVDIFDSKMQKVASFNVDPETLTSNYEFRLQQILGSAGTYYIAIHGVAVSLGSKPLPGQPVLPVGTFDPEQAPTSYDVSKYGRVGSYTLDLTYIPAPVVTLQRDNTPQPTPGMFTMTGSGTQAWQYARNVTTAQDNDVSFVKARAAGTTSPISTATFTFSGLQPGTYRVYASWVPTQTQGTIVTPTTPANYNVKTNLGVNASKVQYQVVDGSRDLTSQLRNSGNGAGVVNQRIASNSIAQPGFTELTNAIIQVKGTTVFVRVSNSLSRDGIVIADSVRLVRVGNLPPSAQTLAAKTTAAAVVAPKTGTTSAMTAADLALASMYVESTTTKRK